MFASIDIGTNTVLLLIAERRDNHLSVIHEEQRVPRLGKDVDRDKNLSESGINRVIEVLLEYQDILEGYPVSDNVVITATSAVRDANNRDEFCSKVQAATGWKVRVLSGNEEAKWTYSGALSMLDVSDDMPVMIIDIGGGSTELAYGHGSNLIDSYSYNMGSVRFTERFLKHDPPLPAEIEQCREAAKSMLETRPFHRDGTVRAIGVAGTVTSLAYIELRLDRYDPEKISGYELSTGVISNYIRKFGEMTTSQLLKAYPEVMTGRADIIVAGLIILEGFLNHYGIDSVTVSNGGIRHGAILDNF